MYYLVDKICISNYGHQFFGTQNNGEKTVELLDGQSPENLLEDPSIFWNLVNPLEHQRKFATKESLLKLWKMADLDTEIKIGQQGMVQHFLSKYN